MIESFVSFGNLVTRNESDSEDLVAEEEDEMSEREGGAEGIET